MHIVDPEVFPLGRRTSSRIGIICQDIEIYELGDAYSLAGFESLVQLLQGDTPVKLSAPYTTKGPSNA